jgi:polyferredoxin
MQKKKIRIIILLAFLIFFTYASIKHFVYGGGIAPSVDALCPFGGFESLFTYIFTGTLVSRIMLSSMVLAFAVLLISFIFSRGFCGWICPFGTIQELLGKLKKKKIKLPQIIEEKAIYLKYVILIIIIIGTAITGTLIFRGYDPFMGFFHFGKGILWDRSAEEFASHLLPFILAVIVVMSSIFISRPWCRFFCPLGAITSLFGKLGLTKLVRDKSCNSCKICDKVCPTSVKVSTSNNIKGGECISCNECIEKCPQKSLSQQIFKKKLPYFGLMIVGLLLIVILTAKFSGLMQTLPSENSISCNGDSDEIKGWMSLNDVGSEFDIDLDKMILDLKLPKDLDKNLPINRIGSTYGFTFHTSTIREYIKNFK